MISPEAARDRRRRAGRSPAAIFALILATAVPTALVGVRDDPAAAATPRPAAPGPVTARPAGSTVIRLAWSPAPGTQNAGYRIWRGTRLIGQTTPAVVRFSDYGLTGSTTYLYTVRTVGPDGSLSLPSVASARTFVSPLVPDPGSGDLLPARYATTLLDAAAGEWTFSSGRVTHRR